MSRVITIGIKESTYKQLARIKSEHKKKYDALKSFDSIIKELLNKR